MVLCRFFHQLCRHNIIIKLRHHFIDDVTFVNSLYFTHFSDICQFINIEWVNNQGKPKVVLVCLWHLKEWLKLLSQFALNIFPHIHMRLLQVPSQLSSLSQTILFLW